MIVKDCGRICLTCWTGILIWLFLSLIMLQSKGQWCLHLPKSELNSNIQGKKEKTKKTFYIKIFRYCWGSILISSLFVSLVSLKPIIVVIHEGRQKMLLMCSRQFFYMWIESNCSKSWPFVFVSIWKRRIWFWEAALPKEFISSSEVEFWSQLICLYSRRLSNQQSLEL